MISTYPTEMIKRLEDRIKELEEENKRLNEIIWNLEDDLRYADRLLDN